ncbi:transmembrane protein, putative (macronuclear) [Tetrahymena thermophila SB210]|uniref:Transmembrane protein, putative n=1 Tax=Tetrahymena thermophila (strain SB210) TaxID=312017 RepID=W7XK92_TETTS|nr:transmembrane protein, putative [Tetrahymena thermophila SB210]EWS76301.1 transmembrane protein, putative [Tetrahymena thermophila SB210]|eukprot:XP_012651085.1 transmembrane protein, putative [Tetrahymena thermophila SB210]
MEQDTYQSYSNSHLKQFKVINQLHTFQIYLKKSFAKVIIQQNQVLIQDIKLLSLIIALIIYYASQKIQVIFKNQTQEQIVIIKGIFNNFNYQMQRFTKTFYPILKNQQQNQIIFQSHSLILFYLFFLKSIIWNKLFQIF